MNTRTTAWTSEPSLSPLELQFFTIVRRRKVSLHCGLNKWRD